VARNAVETGLNKATTRNKKLNVHLHATEIAQHTVTSRNCHKNNKKR